MKEEGFQNELPFFKEKPLSVTELTKQLKSKVEPAFSSVLVQGEVSNFKPAASGHLYFSLKDADAYLSAAAFGFAKRLKFQLKDGLEVICRGKITIYAPRGSYQLTIESIEPVGAGALALAVEQLKEKLSREGLFATERKRAIPRFPKSVAIVTSPTGAAIRDILNVMGRLAPHVAITIIPAVVQGDDAAAQITRALKTAQERKLGEIVLLTRGGGSIEDLWCFNDENLAREIAKSTIPVISAVGHEIDFTISDFVADLRAATPSAAAEIIASGYVQSQKFLSEAQARLLNAMRRSYLEKRKAIEQLSARLVNPKDKLNQQAQKLDESVFRLEQAILRLIERKKAVFERNAAQLNSISPLQVLVRGYSFVKETDSSVVVRSQKQLKSGMKVDLHFSDGVAHAEIV